MDELMRRGKQSFVNLKKKVTNQPIHAPEDFSPEFIEQKRRLKYTRSVLKRLGEDHQVLRRLGEQFVERYRIMTQSLRDIAVDDGGDDDESDLHRQTVNTLINTHVAVAGKLDGMLRALDETLRLGIDTLDVRAKEARAIKEQCHQASLERQQCDAKVESFARKSSVDTSVWQTAKQLQLDTANRFNELLAASVSKMRDLDESKSVIAINLLNDTRVLMNKTVEELSELLASTNAAPVMEKLPTLLDSLTQRTVDRHAREKSDRQRNMVVAPSAKARAILVVVSNSDDTVTYSVKAEEHWTPPLHMKETISFQLQDCIYINELGHIGGTLIGTNYRVLFVPDGYSPTESNGLVEPWMVPAMSITRVRRDSTDNGTITLTIECITCRTYVVMLHATVQNAANAFQYISSMLSHVDGCFAFSYVMPMTSQPGPEYDGWRLYDARREYNRLGITSFDVTSALADGLAFRLSNINSNYAISESYPALLAVPGTATDDEVTAAAMHRMRGRVPVICWANRDGIVLARSSQPRTGLTFAQNDADVSLLRRFGPRLIVLDARPRANAIGNVPMGGGWESPDVYRNCEAMEFLGIDNIHAVRSAFVRLVGNADGEALSVRSRDWHKHIRTILAGTNRLLDCLLTVRVPVLTHCSDGWDRTSQLTSLAQLVLDPYYRTIAGFCVLIEKEWVSFGHQFARRYGREDGDRANPIQKDQRSPIFVQWLDTVWQVMRVNPEAFEFNEALLVFLLYHLYSCRFGTFLVDTEYQRRQRRLREKTQSIWTAVLLDRARFSNPRYNSNVAPVLPLPEGGYEVWTAYWDIGKVNMEEPRVYHVPHVN